MSNLYDAVSKAISDSYPQFMENKRLAAELDQKMRAAGIPVPPMMCPSSRDCAICKKAWKLYTREMRKGIAPLTTRSP